MSFFPFSRSIRSERRRQDNPELSHFVTSDKSIINWLLNVSLLFENFEKFFIENGYKKAVCFFVI